MDVERHERIDPPLAAEWDELADRAGAAPWLRPGWIAAWRRAFGRGRLELLAARDDGRLRGLIALERRRGLLTSTSNWHTPAFAPLVDGEEPARALTEALFAGGGRRVVLAFVPGEGDALAACRAAAAAARHRLIVRTLERSPYVPVGGDWAAYAARRDGKLLRELRRRRRRLGERGRVALEVADGGERLDALLDEGFAVEAAAWKGRAGTAILADASTERFYRDVARWAAGRGCLRLAFLRLDAHALAFDYCIEERGVHYLLKTGYDPAHRAFAPGMLLRREMLERAFALGLTRYELLGADEPWKLSWAEATHERKLLQAFAPSPAGIVDWAAWAVGRPAVQRVLAWPGGA
jgi:CelD/BcsL family acetyltransferase involved in cellulose biosynthesis